ncbi:DNA-binding response regulator [Sphingomonas oleivorans]|uniref:DNA-binding response regulator n=2 Tax=Sphingomonas oleivorans TaxID=1735121 RepID=A0A2T5FUA4_9SPHN|nr:DNA-binding response regulator [Sphingomonas oleivorans]
MSDQAVVHIIDDDKPLREALENLFLSVSIEAATYASVQDFLSRVPENAAGCLVLDIRLPGINGLDFQGKLAEHGITLPVILMSGHGDIPMTVRGMKAGAVDFLPKPFRDQDMLDAVAHAFARNKLERAVADDAARVVTRYATLSPREREVMTLVTAGRLNKQVAGDLNLSEITVKIHRGAAMRKMGARSLPELVRMEEAIRRSSIPA